MGFDTTQIAHLIHNTGFVDQHGGADFTLRRTRQTRAQIERNLRLRVDIQTGGGVVGGVAGLRQRPLLRHGRGVCGFNCRCCLDLSHRQAIEHGCCVWVNERLLAVLCK